MRGTVLYGTGDIRFEDTLEPKVTKPSDAIIPLAATCVCGSDLWSYRGISPVNQPTAMGHQHCGIVEGGGSAVKTVKPGQFVIGPFFASDNTCPHCNFGYQSSCHQREFVGGAQAPLLRVALADGRFSFVTHRLRHLLRLRKVRARGSPVVQIREIEAPV
ncbi:MAG: alcohol dehydrogenase catalytic domain-containing protein [Candidatus Sulfotelmatobacter sp.]